MLTTQKLVYVAGEVQFFDTQATTKSLKIFFQASLLIGQILLMLDVDSGGMERQARNFLNQVLSVLENLFCRRDRREVSINGFNRFWGFWMKEKGQFLGSEVVFDG
jgi:hypothetical protein